MQRPIRQAHFRPPRGLFVRGIFCGDAKIVVHRSRMRARQPFCSGGKESFRKNMSNSPSAFVNLPAPARSRRSWVSVIIRRDRRIPFSTPARNGTRNKRRDPCKGATKCFQRDKRDPRHAPVSLDDVQKDRFKRRTLYKNAHPTNLRSSDGRCSCPRAKARGRIEGKILTCGRQSTYTR